jgi:thioredoxin 1
MAVEILTSQNKDTYINEKVHTIIDFSGEWCEPCKILKPCFIQSATFMEKTNTKINFVTVNVDEENDLAEEYEITGLPTMVLLQNGKVVDRKVGFTKQDNVLTVLKFIGKHFDVKKNEN